MILETVYQLLISNPKYSELPDDFNLYSNLKTFYNHMWLKPLKNHLHSQTVIVTSKEKYHAYDNAICDGIKSWPFTDPESYRFGRKNRKRIIDIIDYFLNR